MALRPKSHPDPALISSFIILHSQFSSAVSGRRGCPRAPWRVSVTGLGNHVRSPCTRGSKYPRVRRRTRLLRVDRDPTVRRVASPTPNKERASRCTSTILRVGVAVPRRASRRSRFDRPVSSRSSHGAPRARASITLRKGERTDAPDRSRPRAPAHDRRRETEVRRHGDPTRELPPRGDRSVAGGAQQRDIHPIANLTGNAAGSG